VKAGERLALSSMDALIERLTGAENPYTCPHGRPTITICLLQTWKKSLKR
jgi:DNA mismatch repair ATPase MutL